jgi:hypothetical protein
VGGDASLNRFDTLLLAPGRHSSADMGVYAFCMDLLRIWAENFRTANSSNIGLAKRNQMDIPSPTLPPNHPNRDDECAIHMENAVMGLWEFFEDAGWSEEEFDRALLGAAMRAQP